MCGIAGYVQRDPHRPVVIERMTARLAHRGPDGDGTWCNERDGWHVALGHRRLAIIDVAGGHQPLGNEDGSLQITYNGEVYNFRDLRAALEPRGHRFATRCDTEVVVHHVEEFGAGGLRALNGMFALGLWDQGRGRLLLARDRAGIKPLYYAPLPCGGIAFASELSALMLHPAVDAAIDPDGLARFFFADYVHPPNTIIRGARKLPPGHFLVWDGGGTTAPSTYWRLEPRAAEAGRTDEELARTLAERLDAAVASQLVSDVPVGVFLSGGIDSSVVAALAQRHASRPMTTFSIGFADPQFDESAFARQVAAHLGTRHVQQTFTEAELLDALDPALSCLDEPMADPSILPTFALSRLAARHVKVVLGGDGGDELWAGYPTYTAHRMARLYRRIPRPGRTAIRNAVSLLPVGRGYQPLEWKARRFTQRWDDEPRTRHLRWMSNLDLPDLSRAVPGSDGVPRVLLDLAPQAAGSDVLDEVLALDFQTYLPGSVLTKVDRASMAHGLEVRPPLLDNSLIDFAFSIRASVRMRGGRPKALLKRACAGLLPGAVIHRRKKGFAIPLARWIAGPLLERVRDAVASSPVWQTGLLDRQVFAGWLDEHLARSADRSRPLWAAVVLDAWYRSMAEARGGVAPAVSARRPSAGATAV
jgi:asparagine synthase (glutamine-hydrolysing)